MPVVQAPQHFNFSAPQSKERLLESLPQLHSVYALQAEDGDIPPVEPPLHFAKRLTVSDGPGILTFINLALIVILIMAVAALYVLCKWQHKRLGALTVKAAGFVSWPAPEPAPPLTQPALAPPVQTAPIAQAPAPRVRIWPQLPPAVEEDTEQQVVVQPTV
jgi:hypothetical protein